MGSATPLQLDLNGGGPANRWGPYAATLRILSRSRNRSVCCFRLLDAEFLEALIFGLGQHEDGDQDTEHAYGSGHCLGGEETARTQQDRKQENADEAAKLAGRGGDSVTRGAPFNREELGWIHECRRVGPQFCEEITDAVNDQKRIDAR